MTENQLLAAQQLVIALTRQLRLADEKLTTLEDLIGDLRTRMRKRGLSIHPPRQLCKRTTPISTKNTVAEPPSGKSRAGTSLDESRLIITLQRSLVTWEMRRKMARASILLEAWKIRCKTVCWPPSCSNYCFLCAP
jgi:hypothetical protein